MPADILSTERLKNIITPAIQTLGFELVDCQFVTEFGRKTLRILVDVISPKIEGLAGGDKSHASEVYTDIHEDGELSKPVFQGVKAGDVSRLNHQIMAILHAEAPEYTACDVEVSSPGLDRPLITLEHFQRFLNREIKIKLHTQLDNCSHFTGCLLSATVDNITLSVEDKTILINFENIRKANLIPDLT